MAASSSASAPSSAPSRSLHRKKCVPCEGAVPRLSLREAHKHLSGLDRGADGWKILRGGRAIRREVRLKNFSGAVSLVNRIACAAETENHHPDLHLTGYRNLAIELSTHVVKGLSLNDFILAAKIDRLIRSPQT